MRHRKKEKDNRILKDTAYLERIITIAKAEQAKAETNKDHDRYQMLGEFIASKIMLQELLDTIRTTPKQHIGGEHGIAEKLQLTRNGVYSRIQALGLELEAVFNENACCGALLHKSKRFRCLMDDLEKIGTAAVASAEKGWRTDIRGWEL